MHTLRVRGDNKTVNTVLMVTVDFVVIPPGGLFEMHAALAAEAFTRRKTRPHGEEKREKKNSNQHPLTCSLICSIRVFKTALSGVCVGVGTRCIIYSTHRLSCNKVCCVVKGLGWGSSWRDMPACRNTCDVDPLVARSTF